VEVLDEPRKVQELTEAWRHAGARIGFVPTMGALHAGHLALLTRARAENTRLATSIFVNPTQFDRPGDFQTYPRDLARDLRLAEEAGCDLAWTPSPVQMYPPGPPTIVEVTGLSTILEGAARPGHFRGVATVVTKLFTVVKCHRAYFGAKDWQQSAIVRRLVADLRMDLEIVVCPTVREADGLALSSRNVLLTPEERQKAPVLYRALQWGAAEIREGRRDPEVLRRGITGRIAAVTAAPLDYVAVVHPETLEPVVRADPPVLLALAIRFPNARLIDNLLVEP
jgi:pantoate--beta-alanine ligase